MAWDWKALFEVTTGIGDTVSCSAGFGATTIIDYTTVDSFWTALGSQNNAEGVWLHDVMFDTTSEGCAYSTGNPVSLPVAITLGGVGTGSYCTTEDGGYEMIVFRKKNTTPYTRIEKRADTIYHTLHKKLPKKPKSPVLLATTKDAMDGVNKLFDNGSVGEMTETLSVLEGLLEKRKVQ